MKLSQIITKIKWPITVCLIGLVTISCDNKDDETPRVEPQNTAPVAVANANEQVEIGSVVKLDASGSKDIDGDEITFDWAFTSKPEASTATIIGIGNKEAEFTLDKAGNYEVELTVSDGVLESKDTFIISNKTPDIIAVFTTTQGPSLPDIFMQRKASIFITVNFLSSDIAENKITIGDLVYDEVEEFIFEDGYIELIIPENAISGELKLTVGEQSSTWSEIMYVPSFPVKDFVKANDYLETFIRDRDSFFEIGTKFKPLANGKIFGFTYIPYSKETQTITLWDNTAQEILKQVISTNSAAKIRGLNLFEEPISVEKDKEYTISVHASVWESRIDEEDEKGNQFPKTYNYIELISTAFRETESGEAVFPDDEFPDNYIVYGPDVMFAVDPQ